MLKGTKTGVEKLSGVRSGSKKKKVLCFDNTEVTALKNGAVGLTQTFVYLNRRHVLLS